MTIRKFSENVDYELTPSSQAENDQAWDVRILEGPFAESVIRFGNIAFDGEQDCLTFNFMLVSTPLDDLNEENLELQDTVSAILTSILEDAVASDSLVMGNPEEQSED